MLTRSGRHYERDLFQIVPYSFYSWKKSARYSDTKYRTSVGDWKLWRYFRFAFFIKKKLIKDLFWSTWLTASVFLKRTCFCEEKICLLAFRFAAKLWQEVLDLTMMLRRILNLPVLWEVYHTLLSWRKESKNALEGRTPYVKINMGLMWQHTLHS